MANTCAVGFPKNCLETTLMYKFQVRGGTVKDFNIIDLEIENFLQMKPGVVYRYLMTEFKWYFIVIKKKEVVTIDIVTQEHEKFAECFVYYGEGKFSSPVYTEKVTNRMIEGNIPFSLILDCRNTALKNGTLCLLFKGKSEQELLRTISPFTGIKMRKSKDTIYGRNYKRLQKNHQFDDEAIVKCLRSVSASNELNFWDFVIYLPRSGELHAHKAVLAARSKFFYKYMVENKGRGEIMLPDTTYEACASVLRFLYCANLKIRRLDVMMEVIEMAVRLEIKSLVHICSKCLTDGMDETTCFLVRSLGRRLGLEKLVELADDFISQNIINRNAFLTDK